MFYICFMKDTRKLILEKNFHAMHLNGFQGMRTDKVISDLGITKGAFYHYFSDKLSLGYAIIEEIIAPQFISTWQGLENFKGNPIDGIVEIIKLISSSQSDSDISLGCPLNNLMQEMSPLEEGFKLRLNKIISKMHYFISAALQSGKDQNQVIKSIEPHETAYFIISSIEGSFGIAKTLQSKTVFNHSINQLIIYLETLKIK